MTTLSTLPRLNSIPLFEGLSPSDLEVLSDHLKQRMFKTGDTVMKRGDEANSLFIVTSGTLVVEDEGVVICERRQNEVVGEQALIDETERSATLIAHGRVELLELDRVGFDKMMQCSPAFAKNLLKILSAKLREATHERAIRYGREERLQEMFGQHHSKEQLEKLLLSPDLDAYLAPQRVEATVLYSDIRGFTTTSEKIDPNDLANQLNAYLSDVIECVFKYGGLIDNFIGDAFLAVFGVPDQKEDDAKRAVECALELEAKAQKHMFGGQPLKIGIGINTGTVFYGHLGNNQKRQLTILGDVVNTAARLESETKSYSENIFIEESTVQKLHKQFPFEFVHKTQLKGRSTKTAFYTLRTAK